MSWPGGQLGLLDAFQRWCRGRDGYRPAGESVEPSRHGVEPIAFGPKAWLRRRSRSIRVCRLSGGACP